MHVVKFYQILSHCGITFMLCSIDKHNINVMPQCDKKLNYLLKYNFTPTLKPIELKGNMTEEAFVPA